MTWQELGKAFAGVVLPFSFLAFAPFLLNITAEIGPPSPQISVLAAFVSGVCIAITFMMLRRRKQKVARILALCGGMVFLAAVIFYGFLESHFVFKSEPPSSQRRVMGFIYVDDKARKYVEDKGSVLEALKSNAWEADRIFTRSSINIAKAMLIATWYVVGASLSIGITAFTFTKPFGKSKSTSPKKGPQESRKKSKPNKTSGGQG